MNEPYLAIYVRDHTLFFAKKLPSETRPRDILEIDVSEVMSDDFDDASRKLGSTVLGILRLWHPNVLHNWSEGSGTDDKGDQHEKDFDIAMHLISKSVSAKTKAHVGSIDVLLREQSQRTKAAHEFFNDSWPTIRARLEKFAS
jgi:hypothetical protein